MIVEVVAFDLPPGTGRAEALALYRQSAPRWLANPDLVQKYYVLDESGRVGGGIYVWRSREAVQRWHGDDYRDMVRARYGAAPRITILDAIIHLDPVAGTLTEL